MRCSVTTKLLACLRTGGAAVVAIGRQHGSGGEERGALSPNARSSEGWREFFVQMLMECQFVVGRARGAVLSMIVMSGRADSQGCPRSRQLRGACAQVLTPAVRESALRHGRSGGGAQRSALCSYGQHI